MKQNVVWGVVAVVVLAAGVMLPFGGSSVVERVVVGGVSSDSSHKFFAENITVGGQKLATTTGVTLSTYTLAAGDLVNKTIIAINPSVDLALKFSATSSAQLVPAVGDTAVFYILNASTTAAAGITVSAADLTVDLQKNEDVADLKLLGLDWAKVTVIRNAMLGNGAVTVIYDEMTEAD